MNQEATLELKILPKTQKESNTLFVTIRFEKQEHDSTSEDILNEVKDNIDEEYVTIMNKVVEDLSEKELFESIAINERLLIQGSKKTE